MTIRQRSTGWAIHLGLADIEMLLGNNGKARTFRTRKAARKWLQQFKVNKTWPWPRARVVPVNIRVETRG